MHPDRDKSAGFWLGGIIAEVFNTHPFLTSFVVLGLISGAVCGVWIGWPISGFVGALIGFGAGACGGVLLVLILLLILVSLGLVG